MAKKKTNVNGKLLVKVNTGIEGFNTISDGGLPKGRATLVSGTSGSGKTIYSKLTS